MKKEEIKISANEINRYVYCPYQWYYGKVYGQKVLKEKYKALNRGEHHDHGNFKKGLRFHKAYYRSYRIKRGLTIVLILAIGIFIIGGILQWLQW